MSSLTNSEQGESFEDYCKRPVWFCGNMNHSLAVSCPDDVVVKLPEATRKALERARIDHEGFVGCQSRPRS